MNMHNVIECGQVLVKIHELIDDEKCLDAVRKLRWPYEVQCPRCTSNKVIKHGHKKKQPHCQKYFCRNCDAGTVVTILMTFQIPCFPDITNLYAFGYCACI